jgi:hypothetical protein
MRLSTRSLALASDCKVAYQLFAHRFNSLWTDDKIEAFWRLQSEVRTESRPVE